MEPMTEEEALQWDRLINRAARFVASDFPDVTFEDITQAFWVELLSKTRRPDVNHPGVNKIITRRLKKHAWDVRKDQLAQSAQYLYRTSDVRIILETVFFKEEWHHGYVPDDAKSHAPPNGMDAVELRADITAAYEGLSENYQGVLIDRYVHGIEPDPSTRERRRLNRAIQRLTDRLNNYYRPRPRRAMSNAAARALIENQEGS